MIMYNMKKGINIKKYICGLIILLLFLIMFPIIEFNLLNSYSQVNRKLSNMDLKQFNYYRTEEEKRSSD